MTLEDVFSAAREIESAFSDGLITERELASDLALLWSRHWSSLPNKEVKGE